MSIIFRKAFQDGNSNVKVWKHSDGSIYLDIHSFYEVPSGEYVSHDSRVLLTKKQILGVGRALILAHSVTEDQIV